MLSLFSLQTFINLIKGVATTMENLASLIIWKQWKIDKGQMAIELLFT